MDKDKVAHRRQRQLLAVERSIKCLTEDISEDAVSLGAPQEAVDAYIAARAHLLGEIKMHHDAAETLCLSIGVTPQTGGTNKDED